MRKNIIIIIIFILVTAIAIIFGFVWWQKSVPKKVEENADQAQQTAPKVDQAQLAADYEESLRALLPEYKQILESPAVEKLDSIRQKLLALKLPAELRDLHAQLVLLLDKAGSNSEPDSDYLKDLEIIISKYDWVK